MVGIRTGITWKKSWETDSIAFSSLHDSPSEIRFGTWCSYDFICLWWESTMWRRCPVTVDDRLLTVRGWCFWLKGCWCLWPGCFKTVDQSYDISVMQCRSLVVPLSRGCLLCCLIPSVMASYPLIMGMLLIWSFEVWSKMRKRETL